MEKNEKVLRDLLADMFSLLAQKVRKGELTATEVRAILSAVAATGGVKATVKELAEFYGQSEDNIRHVIHRNFMPDPVRRVYYDFGAFNKIVPQKWRDPSTFPAD